MIPRIAPLALAVVVALAGCGSIRSLPTSGQVQAQAGATYLATIRSEHGLPRLSRDAQLERAALEQARLMAASGRMNHTTGLRHDFASRMSQNGVGGTAAENIAAGHMDPAKLFSMWMNSSGHRRNILDPRFRRFGLASATAEGSSERYWALVLAD